MLNLSTLTLKFQRHSLEKQFCEYQAASNERFRRVFVVAYVLFYLGVFFHQANRGGVVIAPLLAGFWGLAFLLGSRSYSLGLTTNGREQLCPIRLLLLLITTVTALVLVVRPVEDWLSLSEVIIIKTALPVHVALQLGLPVLFWDHIPVHALETWIVVASLAPSFCSTATESAVLGSPGGVPHDFHKIWDHIDTMALRVLEGMFGRAVYNTAACPSNGACYQLFIFVHVFFGGGVVSYVVWLRERSARAAFLAQEWEAEGWGDRPERAGLERVLGVVLVVHALVFITLFAALWRALGTFIMMASQDGLHLTKFCLWDRP